MSKPKMIFFDIDGTLLSHETGQIPDSAKRALQKAKDAGIKLLIATGRHKQFLKRDPWWETFGFEGFVTLNGGYCFVGDELIHHSPLSPEDVSRGVDYVIANEIPCIFCEAEEMYASRSTPAWEAGYAKVNAKFPPICDVSRAKGQVVYQLAIQGLDYCEGILAQTTDGTYTSWSWDGFDVIAKSSNKLVGITAMAKYFGADISEVAVLGDGHNDIEMIAGAGIGIAMGNASDEVKAQADYVTADIDKDGVAQAIDHLLG